MKMMLGEQGTEQFVVTSRQDGKLICEQKIHDPFITCVTVVWSNSKDRRRPCP